MRMLERKEVDVEATTIEVELNEPQVEAPAPRRSPQGFEFELPIGHVDEDGRIHRSAVLRKMTGRDEAIMADRRNRNSGARMMSELLASCLIRLGNIASPSLQVVRSLYSADRYYLLLQLRAITFGSEMQATYACPTCRESLTLLEDIDTLEVRRLDGTSVPADIVVELDDGYYDRMSGETHHTALFRHPTGEDEEKISSIARENASHAKNALMARSLVALGDIPRTRLDGLGTAIFNDLTLGDRSRIDQALNEEAPGVEMDRELTCVSCGRQFRTTLDLSGFLAPS
jgi:uncharacterized protein YbaR (Trm112 family)